MSSTGVSKLFYVILNFVSLFVHLVGAVSFLLHLQPTILSNLFMICD